MNSQLWVWSCVALLLHSSCIDTYDIDISPNEVRRLAIDGRLTADPEFPHATVVITRLFDFSPEGIKPATIRTVTLFENEETPYDLTKENLNRFSLYPENGVLALKPRVGHSYHVEIVHHNGTVYRSTPETLLETPPLRRVSVDTIKRIVDRPITGFTEISTLQFKVDVDLLTKDGTPVKHLLWSTRFMAYLNPEITLDLRSISLFTVDDLNATSLENHVVFEKNLEFYSKGYGFEVEQFAISSEAYRYWSEVKETLERRGGQFEAAPGIVLGNMENQSDPTDVVYGYFYAGDREANYIYVPHDGSSSLP